MRYIMLIIALIYFAVNIVSCSNESEKLSHDDVKVMLKENDLYNKFKNPDGKGLNHNYQVVNDGIVVDDKSTGLMWEQSGSSSIMNYNEAKNWIEKINENCIVEYHDWRLLKRIEAMGLMKKRKLVST